VLRGALTYELVNAEIFRRQQFGRHSCSNAGSKQKTHAKAGKQVKGSASKWQIYNRRELTPSNADTLV
jgi:hypothetical protein